LAGAAAVPESYPADLLYHSEHDWAKVTGGVATFGITWYAQDSLGEVVHFDPPDIGSSVSANESYAEIESIKTVSDVYAPLSGEVTEVNEAVSETPELINEDPYDAGWLIKVKLTDPSEAETLLDAAAYQELLKQED
jgi:glycine cleavage system H protein